MNILNIFFNIFFYFCFQTRLCCESSQTEDYQCVCMHGCMYVYVCVCVYIYICRVTTELRKVKEYFYPNVSCNRVYTILFVL